MGGRHELLEVMGDRYGRLWGTVMGGYGIMFVKVMSHASCELKRKSKTKKNISKRKGVE